ncbi:DUF202 domain-containing protein [Rhodococcus opacus]|nr:DUF202 domain-containing protein [Rhodococcus opacus]
MTSPVEAGAANERTALAWQRTALSLVAGAAVCARLTWSELDGLGLAVLGMAGALATWVFVVGTRGYGSRHLADCRSPRPRDGRTAFALTCATALIAGAELVALTT